MRRIGIAALVLLALAAPRGALAQLQTGNLYGTVVDDQGAPLPGVTVTLSGNGPSQIQVTNAQGQFRFLGLPPGSFSLKAELEGFSTVDYPNIEIRVGRNTTIEVTLSPAVEDVIMVTSESPLLDERRISTGATVTQTELEKIPTARDPWAVLQQSPGVLTDRTDIGGNEGAPPGAPAGPPRELTMEDFARILTGDELFESKGPATYRYDAAGAGVTFGNPFSGAPSISGESAPPAAGGLWLLTPRDPSASRFGGPVAGGDQAVWSVDGVVITDMAALGSSPSYYDFDSFEEMQVTTGGSDATIATGGVVLNMVTKRGTNEWRGSGRYLISDDDWKSAESSLRNPDAPYHPLYNPRTPDRVPDYGAELGGPIIKDRLWIWGSYGAQRIDLQAPAGGAAARPAAQEWNWEAVQELAKKLTVDANGNDATSPAFDPTRVAQFGYGLDCGIPQYSIHALGTSEPAPRDVCPAIRSSLQNLLGTGAFQGNLYDPFALPTYHVGGSAPPSGRIGGITVDPSDPSGNTVYLAGGDGSAWKTTNFLTTDPDGPAWTRQQTTWDPSRFGDDPTAGKLEDTHIFSSNFYLTGLYSVVNGGFQLVPEEGQGRLPTPAVGFPSLGPATERFDVTGGFVPGYVPDTPFLNRLYGQSAFSTFTMGAKWRLTGPDNPVAAGLIPFYVFQRDDFTLCPNGASVGAWNAGTPVDLGNGSSFVPLIPQSVQCDDFDWETITPRLGLTYALGAERKTLLRASYSRFADQLGTGFPYGQNRPVGSDFGLYVGEEHPFHEEVSQGGLVNPPGDAKNEDAIYLQDRIRLNDYFSLNLGVRADAFEEPRAADPAILNPVTFNGFPTIPLDQVFGGRFQVRIPQGGFPVVQQGPGGSVVVGGAAAPTVLLVSLGQSTGQAFRARVLADGPLSLDGIAVLEPVAAPAGDVAELERTMDEAGAATVDVDAYCFQFDGQVPTAGTAYRFAPPAAQARFAPLMRVLDAGRRVMETGGLTPDTDPDSYFHAISQWSVWAREKGLDLESFRDSWLGLVKKNVEQAGEEWTEDLANAVRDRVPGRWRDIQKILAEADRGD